MKIAFLALVLVACAAPPSDVKPLVGSASGAAAAPVASAKSAKVVPLSGTAHAVSTTGTK